MVIVQKPAPELASQIEICWSSVWKGGDGSALYEILPSGNMTLMFRFSGTVCQAFLLGPVTSKISLNVDQSCDYFCVRFRPGQAPKLVDVHPIDVLNSGLELTSIWGISVSSLGDRLQSYPNHASRQLFVEGLVRSSEPLVEDERCRWATAFIDASGGQVSVSHLAYRLGIHTRSLERSFLDHCGISPKRLIRMTRLQHFIAHSREGRYQNLSDLAYICGYSDQSHMIKDLKELTGRLPGEVTSCHILVEEQPVHCKSIFSTVSGRYKFNF